MELPSVDGLDIFLTLGYNIRNETAGLYLHIYIQAKILNHRSMRSMNALIAW